LRRCHEPLHRQVEAPALGVLQQQEVGVVAVGGERAQAVIARDSVLLVHHQVVRGQVVERGDGRAPLEQRPPQSPSLGPEDLLLAEHDQAERGDLESGRALAHHHPEPLRAPEGGLGPWLEVVLGQHLAQAIALPLVVHHQADREALAAPVANLGRERLELAAEAAHRARAHRDAGHRTVAALEQRQLEPLEAREQGRERRRRRRVVGRRLQ